MKKYFLFLGAFILLSTALLQAQGSFVLPMGDKGKVTLSYDKDLMSPNLAQDIEKIRGLNLIYEFQLTWSNSNLKESYKAKINYENAGSGLTLPGKNVINVPGKASGIFIIKEAGNSTINFKLNVVSNSDPSDVFSRDCSIPYNIGTSKPANTKPTETSAEKEKRLAAAAKRKKDLADKKKRDDAAQKKAEAAAKLAKEDDLKNKEAENNELAAAAAKASEEIEREADLAEQKRLEEEATEQEKEGMRGDKKKFEGLIMAVAAGIVGLILLIIAISRVSASKKKKKKTASAQPIVEIKSSPKPKEKPVVENIPPVHEIKTKVEEVKEVVEPEEVGDLEEVAKESVAEEVKEEMTAPLISIISKVEEKKPEACTFNLEEHWANTAISTLTLSPICISALNAFIQEKNVQQFQELHDADIPEIGGFLLGNYQENDNKQFEVSIEKFVPITAEDQDTYRIEFGTQAWLELDRVKEEFPDLTLIGWFHTHPGHGLFLSQPDLNIHEGFFRQPYQVALEMDTMTDRLDIAFFTRTLEGKLNNTDDRLSENWFSWLKLIERTQV